MKVKVSNVAGFLIGLALSALVLGFVVLRVTRSAPEPRPHPVASTPAERAASSARPPAAPEPASCGEGPAMAAQANAASLTSLVWTPFGHEETGWATYAPLISHEIGTACGANTPGFARALAAWQAARGLPPDGVLTEATFDRIRDQIELRRPFVQVSARGLCPAPPPASTLATATPQEGFAGKAVVLRLAGLKAYRRMVAAARAEDPRIGADPRALTIFSGFRGPQEEGARCAQGGGCDNRSRATCSAHRTGLALDLYVGQAPGFGPDSSAEANRLFMSRTPVYRWLVANAGRFGFVPYPYEPWHWEWTGEAP